MLTWTAANAVIPAVHGIDVLLLPIARGWYEAHRDIVKIFLTPYDIVQSWLPVWTSCLASTDKMMMTMDMSHLLGS